MQILFFDFSAFAETSHRIIQFLIAASIITILAILLSSILHKLIKVYFERLGHILKLKE